MKKFASFLAVMAAVLSLVAWVITLAVPADTGSLVARSVWASVAVAVVVQAMSFGLMRLMQPVNVMAGYALGMILRILSLVLFGYFGVKGFGLALQPALLSLAGFFFVSTLIEPFFLKP
jgi:hypothetical protein